MINFKHLTGFFLTLFAANSMGYASATNFNCPDPAAIQSTDFTAPSIWIAPPVPHSLPDQVGVGLGGRKVQEFLGAEEAEVNHHKGWVCVYRTKGGTTVNDYQRTIRQIVLTNHFLNKYLAKVDKAFDDAEPYLKKYPKDTPIGFVGYQAE